MKANDNQTLPTIPPASGDAVGAAAPEMGTAQRPTARAQTMSERATDMSVADMPNIPESIDEYRLIRLIGQGGMGMVFLAEDTALERKVAVKLMTHASAARRQRLAVEARAAARLQHPNVVTIHRVGLHGQIPYIVEEYLRGAALDAMPKPVAPTRARAIGLALARGLAAAHRRGVLHRDIKPANVMVQEDGGVKLVDFGLAKLLAPTAVSGNNARLPNAAGEPGDRDQTTSPATTSSAATASAATASAATASAATGLADRDADVVTMDEQILGTPYYMAPEIWRGEPATTRSDVYSLGVVLYELLAGQVPFHEVPAAALAQVVQSQDPADLSRAAAAVAPRLASIVHRCLARAPAERFASADGLRDALEELDAATNSVVLPAGSPYRGLLAFEAEHRGVFFGRAADVRRIGERLRSESFVLIAGASGVGKSSLVRAGVLPMISELGLGDGRSWATCTLVPGRQPLSALIGVVADRLGIDDAALAAAADANPRANPDANPDIHLDPNLLIRQLRGFHGRSWGTVLFVDQLEELVTSSEPHQAQAFAEWLALVAERVAGVRIIATIRGDYVTELAALAGLGELVERALYIVRALDREGIRESIVGPARAKGMRFENQALVDALIAAGIREGSLPLLQFALAQLWEARDDERGLLTAASLTAMGGVAGAMSRYADQVLETLLPAGRRAARHVLMRLVTSHGSRARHTKDELVCGDADRRVALEMLVTRRLVIAREVDGKAEYELAHEALITGWTRLRHWLNQEQDKRAVIERITAAAIEWQRFGKARDLLWRGRMLRAAEDIAVADVSTRAAAFLAASRRGQRRRWWLRRLIPTAVVVALALGYWGVQYQQQRDTRRAVQQITAQVRTAIAAAERQHQRVAALQATAFAAYANTSRDAGNAHWRDVLSTAKRADDSYAVLSHEIEVAVQQYPGFRDLRDLLAETLYGRAILAELLGRTELVNSLRGRLSAYDDTGQWSRRWTAPVSVAVTTIPEPVAITLARYLPRDDGKLAVAETKATRTGESWPLVPGSYVLLFSGTERWAPLHYPFEIQPGSAPLALTIVLPAADKVPAGFAYIAPGHYWFGFGGTSALEPIREWLYATPRWRREIAEPYLIAINETTFAQYIEFLTALPPHQRQIHMPYSTDQSGLESMKLIETANGFALELGNPAVRFLYGDKVAYRGRTGPRATQDWHRFPVTGIAIADARAYTQWLRTRAPRPVPGAILCREDQWERAARGADGRTYPHGERLAPEDANFEETYESTSSKRPGPASDRNRAAVGRDEVGSHPASRSPFGLDDMAGNVWEMTLPVFIAEKPVARGGSYFQGYASAMAPNREYIQPEQRDSRIGFRVCAPFFP